MTPVRGRVYWADLGAGEKPWLCVSNNARNKALDGFMAVRITTTDKKLDTESIVPLTGADPLVGFVLCDDMQQIYQDEIRRDGGALTMKTIMAVAHGLKVALALL